MDIQKALHLADDLAKKQPGCIGPHYTIFEKYDGWYGYFNFADCIIHTGQRRPLPSAILLCNKLVESVPSVEGRLIFEILVRDVPEFHVLNGILNRAEPAEGIYLMVHDFIPTLKLGDQWMSFSNRYKLAHEIVGRINLPQVELAKPIAFSQNYHEWQGIAQTVWDRGGEGIICKQTTAQYHAGKRNSTLIKLKKGLDVDLLCTNLEGGDSGKYTDTLGRLILVDSKGKEHRISGMSDAERNLWWHNPDLIVGKVVKCKAMEWLPDGSLREASYTCIRHDKSADQID